MIGRRGLWVAVKPLQRASLALRTRSAKAYQSCPSLPGASAWRPTDQHVSGSLLLGAVLAGSLASGWGQSPAWAEDKPPTRRYSVDEAKEVLGRRLKPVRDSLKEKRIISTPPPLYISKEPNGIIRIHFEVPLAADTHDLIVAINNALRGGQSNADARAFDASGPVNLCSSVPHAYTGAFAVKNQTGSFIIARNQRGGTGCTFFLDDYVTEHDINAIVAAYETALSKVQQSPQIIIGAGPMGGARGQYGRMDDPRSRLEQLGVRVYDAESLPQGESLDWDALAGYEEVKQTIKDTIVLALKHPDTYDELARRTRKRFESNRPKAVLFEGPPGTGKTLTARIIANKTGIPMVHISVENVLSKWYSESEKNMVAIFDACDELGGAIIFIDEIDALVKARSSQQHEVTGRVLSVLLQKLDGFASNRRSILVCATNRKEDLDPALLSRFSLCVRFDLPDLETRGSILALYAKHLTSEQLGNLAQITASFSARDLKELCEQTERRWASKLIRMVEKEGLPPFSEYEASARTLAQSKYHDYAFLDQI